MEEDQYKATYNRLAEVRCVFEKALTNNQASCAKSSHFWLADREGYACKCRECSDTCDELLKTLRQKSSFVLKLREVDGPLPHNMDIRVQVGGLRGLARLVQHDEVDDVHRIITQALDEYGAIDALPFSTLVQSVEQFKARRRRSR